MYITMGVENPQLQTEVIISKEQVDTTKLDIDRVKSQIETQLSAKTLKDEILNDADRKLTHEQIVGALKQYENQPWPDVIDKNSAAYVLSLQLALKAAGYDVGKIDALYGHSTKDAVKKFQKAQGLGVDGRAGPYTIEKIIAVLGGDTVALTPDTRKNTVAKTSGAVTGNQEKKASKEKKEKQSKLDFTEKDKEWIKNNFGVTDISKVQSRTKSCNGLAIKRDQGDAVSDYIYIGNYVNGKLEGKGIYRSGDYYKYVGNFKNDKEEGKGKAEYIGLMHHVGDFKDGELFSGTEIFIDGSGRKPVVYRDGKKIIEKTPEKTFLLEQLNDIQMKTIWDKYIAPEFSSKRQKEWLKRKGVDKGVKVFVSNEGNRAISLNTSVNLCTIDDAKKVGDGKNINLVKFVAVVKKTLGDSMAKEYKTETLTADNALVQKSIEDKYLAFDKVFTDADRKNSIIAKQIEKLQSYFSNKDQLLLDDTSVIVKGNKKYIQIDLDNKDEDKPWTENILIPYEMGIVNGKFQLGTFQQAVRKYIIDELFSKKDKTDIFTKIRDQNIKLDL